MFALHKKTINSFAAEYKVTTRVIFLFLSVNFHSSIAFETSIKR